MGCGSGIDTSTGEQMPQEPSSEQEVDDTHGNTHGTTENSPLDPSLSFPAGDAGFTTLPDGRKLGSISVNGTPLFLAKGTGTAFTATQQAAYLKLKMESQKDPAHKVQWVFMDLDNHKVIEKSLSSQRKIFGASSSKIYVAAALLSKQKGVLKDSQLQLMANMLVVSSNEAWVALQSQIGDGSADRGRQWIQDFTQQMGYEHMVGFQGSLGKIHGNELIADESAEMLYDIYKNHFPGAELQWKLMHTCRTGANRGRKYIPKSIFVGGKTGTYDGPTVNPETGGTYTVNVRNHLLVFNVDGRQFGLAVLANSGTDESAALLAGGLLREYTSIP